MSMSRVSGGESPGSRKEYKRQWAKANSDKVAAQQRRYREKNPAKNRAKKKRYYDANREHMLVDSRRRSAARHKALVEAAATDPTAAARLATVRNRATVNARRSRLRRLGLTPEDYEARLAAQGGVCAVCRKPDQVPGRRLVTDHCHQTSKLRGLLCGNCNKGIGLLQDGAVLEEALDYIRSFNGTL